MIGRDKRLERTDFAKQKQRGTLDAKKKEKQEKQQELVEAKAELLQKEYQDNLKDYLEQKLFDLTYRLKHLDKYETLSTIELKSLLTQKNTIGASPKYSNTELAILFNYYKEFIEKINEKQRFLPTKKNFCSFIGISSFSYDSYRKSDDQERREIMQMIDDYITDIMLTEAQNGELKEITTIFRSKAEHGMVEAQAPVVIEHKGTADLEKIKRQIQAVNQGRSLKTIELKKQPDGSYAEEEEI